MTRDYNRDLRPPKRIPEVMKRYWQYGPRKPCGHARAVLSCKHCIDAARFEAHWFQSSLSREAERNKAISAL